MTDFFISYTHADQAWAEWIAWVLEDAGYKTKIQAWDFGPGSNFVLEMQKAAAECERTIAVLSPKYFESKFTAPEWAAALGKSPTGEDRVLVPVRIEEVALQGLWPQIVYIDLVGLGEAAAKAILLERVRKSRRKPRTQPAFPGQSHPIFPGSKGGEDAKASPDAGTVVLAQNEISPRGPLPPGSRMPFAPNPLFVGREDDLRTLARYLQTASTAAIGEVKLAAASGMGGIGKSQLAVEFVHRYGQFFQGGVYWLSFADPAAIPSEAVACGRSLKLHPSWESLPLVDQTRLVQDAWSLPVPRLLVFDNCEEEQHLTEWRPRFGGARVLVTSRRARWSRSLGIEVLSLSTLPRDKSIELLRSFLDDLQGHDPDLAKIAEELGDLPLALHLAGSYLREYEHAPFGQPSAYMEALRKGSLLDHPSLQGEDAEPSPTGHELHVGRTFALSLDRLDAENEADRLARALFARAAFFAPSEPIPRDLLPLTIDLSGSYKKRETAEIALLRLTSLGLLEISSGGAIVIHRLVAVFAENLAEWNEAGEGVWRTLLGEADRSNSAGIPGPLLAWQAHLRFVTEQYQGSEHEVGARLCRSLGFHLYLTGDYPGARPYFERALAISEKALGPEHPVTITDLNNLANILREQGDLTGARLYLERALAIRLRVLGPEHPDTAVSLNSLGFLHRAEGDLAGARPYYERALAICEKALGSEHPDTALGLNNLGFLHQAEGDLAGARRYYERALAIREKVQGPEHPDTALSLNNLGFLHRAEGDLAGARLYYERAVATLVKVLGSNHPYTQVVQENLSSLRKPLSEATRKAKPRPAPHPAPRRTKK